jgi:hypothetical protein
MAVYDTNPPKLLAVKKDRKLGVVMGLCKGYQAHDAEHFIQSFLVHDTYNHMVLFVDDPETFMIPSWKTNRLQLIKIHDTGRSPVLERFFLYQEWAKNLSFIPDYFCMLDVRDTFFQGDVFHPLLQYENGIHFFAEGYLMKQESQYNHGWVRDCAWGGEKMLSNMSNTDFPIFNGGSVLIAGHELLLQFLTKMTEGISLGCNDQGLVNILAFSNAVQPLYLHTMAVDSWIGHLLVWERQAPVDEANRIYSPAKILFAAVHQGVHIPKVWELRWNKRVDASGNLSIYDFS